MNLQENIQRIQSLMITEDKEAVIKKLINTQGLYKTILLMGGYDKSFEKHLTREDKIDFIKYVVTKLCEEEDDIEIQIFGSNIYIDDGDYYFEVIEVFRPNEVIIAKYEKQNDNYDDDDSWDYDDNYMGYRNVKYEQLDNYVIEDIFHFMLTQI